MLSAFRKPTKEIPPFTPFLPERHWSFHVSQFPTRSPQARTPTIFTSVFTWFNPLFRNPLHILPKSMKKSPTKILEYYPMYYEIMDSTPNQELQVVLIDSYLNSFFTKHVEKKRNLHMFNTPKQRIRNRPPSWPNSLAKRYWSSPPCGQVQMNALPIADISTYIPNYSLMNFSAQMNT